MARITSETGGGQHAAQGHSVTAHGQDTIELPHPDFIANAEILRDGQDLVLRHPDGTAFTVADYFSASPAPTLTSETGASLTPALVQSFVQPAGAMQYAQAESANDVSAIGTVSEVTGKATITRADGTAEAALPGMPVYEGDIVETDAQGAVNITFLDETSFAVSSNARLSIDEYVFDPATSSGQTNFSVLRGMFVFVSGLIGREDPDDVEINTPVGSIGIRGTTIAGNADTGEITVIEGAIVLRSLDGRSEMTLASQFETARLGGDGTIAAMGTIDPATLGVNFNAMHNVIPAFFSGVQDAGTGEPASTAPEDAAPENTAPGTPEPAAPEVAPPSGYNETSFDGGSEAGFARSSGTATDNPLTAPLADAPVRSAAPSGSESTTTIAAPPPAGLATDAAADRTLVPPPPPAVTGASGTGTASGGTGGTVTPAPAGPIDLHALSAADGYRLTSTPVGDRFGANIAATGDIDGDGIADFAIGNSVSAGTATIRFYNGTGTAIAGSDQSPGPNPGTDVPIAGLGDFDGDGLSDYIIGDPNWSGSEGYMEIVTGAGSITFTNIPPGYNLGAAVAGIGDINGDGYDDVLIGAPGANTGNGKAIVIFGADGLTTVSFADTSPANAQPDFVDDGHGFVMSTGITGDAFGTDVAAAGDFNGDGYDDLMISSPGSDTAYIGFGYHGMTGLAMAPATAWTITGLTAGPDNDVPMFAMGDMNGDGIADVGIADTNGDGGRGILHVLYGNDAYTIGGGIDLSVGPGGGAGFTLRLDASHDEFAGGGSAGDFNGDGRDDMAVAIRTGDMIDIYVLYGNPSLSGSITLDDAFLSNAANAFHMTYSLASVGLANPATDEYDIEIVSPGDLNGDGRDDLVIGAENHNANDGEAIVVFGRDDRAATATGTATAANQSLTGTAAADTLNDGGHAGVSMRGGAGNDSLDIAAASGQWGDIDGGAGYDTLRFMRANSVLDFTAVGTREMTGIERIIMAGTNQDLTISLDDIFRMMQESADNRLLIDSPDAANTLTIDTPSASNLATMGFAAAANQNIGGITYSVFDFNGYQLLIDTNIAAPGFV